MEGAHIVVLGAGPAGATAALGLRRLGYTVTVISAWRRFDAVEGISMRVLRALHGAGLTHAAACAGTAHARLTRWNASTRAFNTEYLLDRPAFDAALRRDLVDAGVCMRAGKVRAVRAVGGGHEIHVEAEQGGTVVRADFLIEARGKAAPSARDAVRGPQTVTVLNSWAAQPGPCGGAVESHPEGWAWMARLPDGRCFWQVSLDVDSGGVPPRDALAAQCARLRRSGLARDILPEPDGEIAVHARSSTATLCASVGGDNWLRVGDAAMTADPLSGNGIFQSMSSALQAPAVVHTLLTHPERASMALGFHAARVRHLFERFGRVGRDFYAIEQQWPAHPFWLARRAWPDAEPAHPEADVQSLSIARKPVIDGGLIREEDVVVSSDQPLGIWHVDGISLAPIVSAWRAGVLDKALESIPPRQAGAVRRWLAERGIASTAP